MSAPATGPSHPAGASRRRLLATTAASLAAIAACEGDGGEGDAPRVVARVNGEPIAAERLAEDLAKLRRDYGQSAFADEHALETIRRRLLDERIDRALLLQAAEARGVRVDDDAVERALLRRRAAYPGGGFDAFLAEIGMPLSALREKLREQILIDALMGKEVNPRILVTDEDVEARFEADPDAWARAAQVRARQIVVRSEEEAARLRREIRRGGDFEALAREHTETPESARGGDLGWFAEGTMPPPIDDVAFALPVGVVSQVVESAYGYHLLQVLETRPERAPDLDAVRHRIRRDLRLEREREAQAAYLERLRAEAEIEIDETALAEVR